MLRLAYLQFYYEFMVAPEEVGLGQAELLTQSLVAPLFLLALMTFCVVVLGSLLILMGGIFKPLARPLSNFLSRLPIIGHFEFSQSNKPQGVARSSSEEARDANELPTKAEASDNTSRSLNFEAGVIVVFVSMLFLAVPLLAGQFGRHWSAEWLYYYDR